MAALYGMKAIRQVYPFSEATVLRDIREMDFPAWQKGGIWVSDTEAIDEWRLGKVREAKNLPIQAKGEEIGEKEGKKRFKPGRG